MSTTLTGTSNIMNNTGSLISNACYMYMNTCIVLATTTSCSETVHIVGETKILLIDIIENGLTQAWLGVAMVMNRVLLSGSKSAMEC